LSDRQRGVVSGQRVVSIEVATPIGAIGEGLDTDFDPDFDAGRLRLSSDIPSGLALDCDEARFEPRDLIDARPCA
jgi:hypothetical protein